MYIAESYMNFFYSTLGAAYFLIGFRLSVLRFVQKYLNLLLQQQIIRINQTTIIRAFQTKITKAGHNFDYTSLGRFRNINTNSRVIFWS